MNILVIERGGILVWSVMAMQHTPDHLSVPPNPSAPCPVQINLPDPSSPSLRPLVSSSSPHVSVSRAIPVEEVSPLDLM